MLSLLFIFDENLLQPAPDSISGSSLRPELVGPQGGDGVVLIVILHALLPGTPINENGKRFCKGS